MPPSGRSSAAPRRAVLGLVLALVLAYLAGVLTADPVRLALWPLRPGAEIDLVVQAYWLIQQHYVDKAAVVPQQMAYAAIRAMLDTLGDRGHTQFLTRTEREFQQASLAGRFGGIGAEITIQGDRPVIVAPMDGTPAQRAGIRPGDVILSVDGEDTARMPLEQVVLKVRGPKGTPVRLTIQRTGEDTPVELTIIREEIQLRAVTSRYFDEPGFLYLRLSQFSAGADAAIRAAVEEARGRGLRGIVMDVRNNPGGLLEQAVNVTSEFLAEGNVLLEQNRDGQRKPYPVRKGGSATDVPLVVLVNHGSASSAEVFAGAIQDQGRGPIVGERTFGTGTVLSSWELRDGSALLLGFAYWLTPNGRMIRDGGITPDVVVELPAGTQPLTPERTAGLSLEEVAAQDPQLGTAFALLPR
ncbi:MAG TPA: S41 family peptidase [Chloroflexota bacterium]|nr:S41 family peptidase [Chloroflexota bacterium]HZU07997.1 S41 family peptidase [Chloroflexota bacterium]